MACTGQDAAARSTRWRCESSGFGIVGQGLLTNKFEDIRCQWDTLRVSQTPIQIDHNSHDFRSSFTPR